MLHNCIEALTDEDYAASSCPYMKQTATMIKEETAAQLLVECLNQDFDPKCGPEINCNNVGTCQFNGGCDCNANFGLALNVTTSKHRNRPAIPTGSIW